LQQFLQEARSATGSVLGYLGQAVGVEFHEPFRRLGLSLLGRRVSTRRRMLIYTHR
jgi:hypothetical protein